MTIDERTLKALGELARRTRPRYLYHGTAAINIPGIEQDGIRPRGHGQGNWAKLPSHPDMIYLSTAYAPYFAVAACENMDDTIGAILEIDARELDRTRLYPDEDFIREVLTDDSADPDRWRPLWAASLKAMGNCCFRGRIPPELITRYAVIDWRRRPWLWLAVADPSISVMNYRLCGRYYRQLTAWLFGDRKTLPEVQRARQMADPEAAHAWLHESRCRDGIRVTTLARRRQEGPLGRAISEAVVAERSRQ